MGVPNKLRQQEPIHHTTADVEDFQVPPIELWNFEVSRVTPPRRQRWKINLSFTNSFEPETGGSEVVGRSLFLGGLPIFKDSLGFREGSVWSLSLSYNYFW